MVAVSRTPGRSVSRRISGPPPATKASSAAAAMISVHLPVPATAASRARRSRRPVASPTRASAALAKPSRVLLSSSRKVISTALAASTVSPSRAPWAVKKKNTVSSARLRIKISRFTASSCSIGATCLSAPTGSARQAAPKISRRSQNSPPARPRYSDTALATATPRTSKCHTCTSSTSSSTLLECIRTVIFSGTLVRCRPMAKPISAKFPSAAGAPRIRMPMYSRASPCTSSLPPSNHSATSLSSGRSRISALPTSVDNSSARSSTTRVASPAPRAWEVNPVVPMRRKLNEKYRNMKTLLPSATAARYTGESRWPTTAVSTRPSSGAVILESSNGHASIQMRRSRAGSFAIMARRRVGAAG